MKSFSAKLPLIVQKRDYSDINKTFDSNHYVMTYNWNVYFPDKLDGVYLDYDKCLELRNNNEG
jgi:DNA-dependent RNA polymerase auxiliary subunit epsilon